MHRLFENVLAYILTQKYFENIQYFSRLRKFLFYFLFSLNGETLIIFPLNQQDFSACHFFFIFFGPKFWNRKLNSVLPYIILKLEHHTFAARRTNQPTDHFWLLVFSKAWQVCSYVILDFFHSSSPILPYYLQSSTTESLLLSPTTHNIRWLFPVFL